MPKKKTRNTTSIKLRRELAMLKKEKIKALKLRKKLIAREKEIEEIRELKRDVARLRGVGTKGEVAKRVGKRLGKDVGRVGWKGLKIAGKFAKNVLEAEAKRQDMDRARAMKRGKKKK